MMRKISIVLSLVLFTARASAETTLDRAEVIKRAQKTAPVLSIARAKVEQAKAGTKGTSIVSTENPSIAILGGVRFGDPRTPELRGQVAIPFDLGGRPGARLITFRP